MKIAALDYRAQSINQAGEVNVSFIEEDNNLFNPTLSYTTPTTIRIGSINLRMFPVFFERNRSSNSENILRVKYIDGSFLMDQYYVGLKSKHHEYRDNQTISKGGLTFGSMNYNANPRSPFGSIPSNFILVGNYIDPCRDFSKSSISDPCNPCPTAQDNNQIQERAIDCLKRRSMEILDVEYTFSDLLSAIRSRGINISVNPSFNNSYKAAYIGSLRSVLQSWCSDFGFSFVFDGSAGRGRIYVYDLSSGININLKGLKSDCSVINFSEGRSIEHTFSKAIVAHYAMEGQSRDHDCESSYGQRLACRPLTLRDLVGKAPWRSGQPIYSDNQVNFQAFDVMEMCCLLSSYNPRLREAVVWFDLYGLRSIEDVKGMINAQSEVSKVSGISLRAGGYKAYKEDFDKNKFTMPLLQMTPKAIASEKPESSGGQQVIFNSILSQLDDGVKADINRMRSKGYKAYFFVASQNADTLQSITDWETEIGQNFLGKYFIRKFNSTIKISPSFVAAGGDSAQFYKQGVDKLDFSYTFPYNNAGSYISELNDKKSGVVEDSFVLVTRSPTPIPPRGEGDEMSATIQTATDILPTRIGYVTQVLGSSWSGLQNKLNSSSSTNLQTWDSKLGIGDFLYVGYEVPSGLNTSSISVKSHPDEKKFFYNSDEYATPITLGLRSLQARSFKSAGITFWFPPQSTVREAESGSRGDNYNTPFGGGYLVYYKTQAKSTVPIFVPKSEIVTSSVPDASNVGALEVNYKEFNNATLNDYGLSNGSCVPNYNQIKKVMNNYCSQMSAVQSSQHEFYTFEIDGTPTQSYDILDGLESFDVSFGGEGTKTVLTFSDYKNNKVEKSETFQEFLYEQSYRPAYLTHKQFTKGTNLLNQNEIPTR